MAEEMNINADSSPQAYRRAVSYIDKSREYYAAHGYGRPYMWASYATVPFTRLDKPLSEATVGVVTTTFPAVFTAPKTVYNLPSAPVPEEMFTKDLSWDKDATHTNDVGSFLPLKALHDMAAAATIGTVADRFYGIPTEYSQRRTPADADQVVPWCREDGVDVVVLVPL